MNSIRSVILQFLFYKGHCDTRLGGKAKETVFLEDGGVRVRGRMMLLGWRGEENLVHL